MFEFCSTICLVPFSFNTVASNILLELVVCCYIVLIIVSFLVFFKILSSRSLVTSCQKFSSLTLRFLLTGFFSFMVFILFRYFCLPSIHIFTTNICKKHSFEVKKNNTVILWSQTSQLRLHVLQFLCHCSG
jgi:hypothetical protein